MSYDVSIHRTGHATIIDLKGTKDTIAAWAGKQLPDFPGMPNTSSAKGDLELYWIGADHWLLRAPLEMEDELLETLGVGAAPMDVSAVRVSDTLAFFSISGTEAAEIMAIASPLDTGRSSFADNGVSYGEAFGLKALIVRRKDGYEIAVERSFADMTEDFLGRAIAA